MQYTICTFISTKLALFSKALFLSFKCKKSSERKLSDDDTFQDKRVEESDHLTFLKISLSLKPFVNFFETQRHREETPIKEILVNKNGERNKF